MWHYIYWSHTGMLFYLDINIGKCLQDSPKGREDDESKWNNQQWPQTEKQTTLKEFPTDIPCICGLKFRSQRGVKTHQTKMGYVSQTVFQEQHSANTDKMSENQSQDSYHNAEDILTVESKDEMQPVLPRIKFPRGSNLEAWCLLDIISKTLHNELEDKEYNQWLNESSQVI